MGKAKKIIAGVLVVAVAGTGIGAGLMQLRKNSQKEVEVTPVSGLLQEYYQQSTNLDGQIASSATQTVTGDKDLVVDQVFVSKGDNVKKDDPLISFDTTLVEMELNIAKLKLQKQQQDHTGYDQSKADPTQGKSAQKQSTHVLHMGYFPVIEEFSRLSIHNCRYMKVFPASPEICHHLVGHIKQVVHFHMNII